MQYLSQDQADKTIRPLRGGTNKMTQNKTKWANGTINWFRKFGPGKKKRGRAQGTASTKVWGYSSSIQIRNLAGVAKKSCAPRFSFLGSKKLTGSRVCGVV